MLSQRYVGHCGEEVFVSGYVSEPEAPTLLIVPGVGWYHPGPNRIWSRIAGMCMKAGMNAYAFDYVGEGESIGNCIHLSGDGLLYSFDTVFKYVRGRHAGRLYCLGHGIGNYILRSRHRGLAVDGLVLYLPGIDKPQALQEVFSSEELDMARADGFFLVEKDKSQKGEFWRSVVGAFHDCSYNPISLKLVQDFVEHMQVEPLSSVSQTMLLVTDGSETAATPDTSVMSVPEFGSNVLPCDWSRNDWPFILDRVNKGITTWLLNDATRATPASKTGRPSDREPVRSSCRTACARRAIVPFASEDAPLFGVLHTPLSTDGKMPCVVLVMGLGGDKVDNHMCGPRFGDYIARNGLCLFRYDTRYAGASTECLSRCTWSGLIADFENALSVLGQCPDVDSDRIVLVCWSEGAKIASCISRHDSRIRGSCFWNPVLFGAGDSRRPSGGGKGSVPRFVKNDEGRLVTALAGETLGIEYFADNKQYDFPNLFANNDMPKKIIWSEDEIGSQTYTYLRDSACLGRIDEEVIGAKHHLFDYLSMGELFEETYDWISSIL